MNCLDKKEAYLGEVGFSCSLASDRGVSCPRQTHHNAREVVMDWIQVRDYLENDKISETALPVICSLVRNWAGLNGSHCISAGQPPPPHGRWCCGRTDISPPVAVVSVCRQVSRLPAVD